MTTSRTRPSVFERTPVSGQSLASVDDAPPLPAIREATTLSGTTKRSDGRSTVSAPTATAYWQGEPADYDLGDLLLSIKGVMLRTLKSRSSVYEAMLVDGFPRPIKTGKRSVAWYASEVDAWLDARRKLRDGV